MSKKNNDNIFFFKFTRKKNYLKFSNYKFFLNKIKKIFFLNNFFKYKKVNKSQKKKTKFYQVF